MSDDTILHMVLNLIQRLETVNRWLRFHSQGDSLRIDVPVPGYKWEIEIAPDGGLVFERFISPDDIDDEAVLTAQVAHWLDAAPRPPRTAPRPEIDTEHDPFHKFLAFVRLVQQAGHPYAIESVRDALMVVVEVPEQRWEVEFFANGDVELERFYSMGRADRATLEAAIEEALAWEDEA